MRIRVLLPLALSVGLGPLACSLHHTAAYDARITSKRMPDGKLWMTTNLAVAVPSSYCHGDDDANCRRYGRLYTWEAAQQACRAAGGGWHLPTNEEWRALAKQFGGVRDDSSDEGHAAFEALTLGGSAGFDVVLGGNREIDGRYARLDAHGFYWTATETAPGNAWLYNFGRGGQALNRHDDAEKKRAFSVRCVQQ